MKKGEQWRMGYQTGYEEASKAYGGCTYCFGKGYSTTKVQSSSRRGVFDLNPINPCSCDRGKQITKNFITNQNI